ncbi:MAG: hypothetical protein IPN89_03280 [Saprospiraceae bacterium]|nr:hypothetical protein [Saprospiraceae bacterium]
MENRQSIQRAIDNGYSFPIGNYFSRGWEIFKRNPGAYIGYTLIFILVSIIINMIPLLGMLIALIVNPALMVGTAIAAYKQEKYNDTEFGNFFKGFDHLAQLIVANIIITLIYFVVAIPLIFVLGFSFITALATGDADSILNSSTQIASMGLWFLIFFILFLYMAISLRWTNYLIVFHQYDAVSAIKTSWKLTNKKWFYHLGFSLLSGIVVLLGVLALFIGIIFALPVIMAADYAGFADVTGMENNDDIIDQIGGEKDLV